VDLDEWIVAAAGKTIREIFASGGETAFRELEVEAIARAATLDGHVIALGGGALLREGNRAAIANGRHKIVYLRAEAGELHRRIVADPGTSDNRPKLTGIAGGGGVEEIQALLAGREPIYRAAAGLEVDVTRLSADEAAERIIQLCGE
jgi:shikimate kinase